MRKVKNLKRPTHILAAIAIIVGAWWCFATLFHPILRIWIAGASDPIPWLGLFVIPMMIIPGAMAFVFLISLNEMAERYFEEPRLLGIVGPILIAWLFYKIAVKILLTKTEPIGTEQPSSAVRKAEKRLHD